MQFQPWPEDVCTGRPEADRPWPADGHCQHTAPRANRWKHLHTGSSRPATGRCTHAALDILN